MSGPFKANFIYFVSSLSVGGYFLTLTPEKIRIKSFSFAIFSRKALFLLALQFLLISFLLVSNVSAQVDPPGGGFGGECTIGCRQGQYGQGVDCPCSPPPQDTCACWPSCIGTVGVFNWKKEPNPSQLGGCGPLCTKFCAEDKFDCRNLCDAFNPYHLCAGGGPSGSQCMTIRPNPVYVYSPGAPSPPGGLEIPLCCPDGQVISGCSVEGGYGCMAGDESSPPSCLSTWTCNCPAIQLICVPAEPSCSDGRPFCGEDGNCCPPGVACIDGACQPCPDSQTLCAGTCCPSGAECVNGACQPPVCPVNQICGDKCCPSGEQCIDGECQELGCPEPRVLCEGACCPEGQECTAGQCQAPSCPEPRVLCENICCPLGEQCIDGVCQQLVCPEPRVLCEGVCCPEGQVCTAGQCQAPSCPEPRVPCEDICCPDGLVCTEYGCQCPDSRLFCSDLCCPAGQVCNEDVCVACPENETVCGYVCCPQGSCFDNVCQACPTIVCAGVCCPSGSSCDANGQCPEVCPGHRLCNSLCCPEEYSCQVNVCVLNCPDSQPEGLFLRN